MLKCILLFEYLSFSLIFSTHAFECPCSIFRLSYTLYYLSVMMKLSMSSDEKDDVDLNNCLQKEVEKALEVWGSIEENPTNKQLSFVAKEIAVDQAYVYLAGQLDVSWTDIKIIEVDYRGDVKRISLETLVKWMELKATEATVIALLKGLLSIDRHDVIVKFDKQFCNN
ncbi:Hypothetical predicted protein [Mytilus galloprovincialis]|uniref:Death domain-containing protein n=1 Tax=Mytilus galloprovincialis TaxID=29158 RepID=A0A8B6BTB6_MYTGA|nr:Hypothetical predicted protein [Mytilus galloprovincialis]